MKVSKFQDARKKANAFMICQYYFSNSFYSPFMDNNTKVVKSMIYLDFDDIFVIKEYIYI